MGLIERARLDESDAACKHTKHLSDHRDDLQSAKAGPGTWLSLLKHHKRILPLAIALSRSGILFPGDAAGILSEDIDKLRDSSGEHVMELVVAVHKALTEKIARLADGDQK